MVGLEVPSLRSPEITARHRDGTLPPPCGTIAWPGEPSFVDYYHPRHAAFAAQLIRARSPKVNAVWARLTGVSVGGATNGHLVRRERDGLRAMVALGGTINQLLVRRRDAAL